MPLHWQEPGSLRASAHRLRAIHNLAVPLRGGADDDFGWLAALADHYPQLSTLGVTLEVYAQSAEQQLSLAQFLLDSFIKLGM